MLGCQSKNYFGAKCDWLNYRNKKRGCSQFRRETKKMGMKISEAWANHEATCSGESREQQLLYLRKSIVLL
jgi:hypothetical protein